MSNVVAARANLGRIGHQFSQDANRANPLGSYIRKRTTRQNAEARVIVEVRIRTRARCCPCIETKTDLGHRLDEGHQLRTSDSDPIRIDAVTVGENGGAIGLTFCPGKCDAAAGWRRDLAQDLDAIVRWAPRAVVTLLEDHEFAMLRVPRLGAEIRQRGIEWHHLPIVDVEPPDERFETAWLTSGPILREALSSGARVVVHCRGGCGRSGTVAARLLVEIGSSPEAAIQRVRAARRCAIETHEQLSYVLGLRRSGGV